MKYLTKQSKLVLSIVERLGHVTAEEVYTEAVKSLPKIAVGTVYRVLNDLSESGIIQRIPVPDAPDRFDKTVAPHEHIICPYCGKVEDLSIEGLAECIRQAVARENYTFCLTVKASCNDCLAIGAHNG